MKTKMTAASANTPAAPDLMRAMAMAGSVAGHELTPSESFDISAGRGQLTRTEIISAGNPVIVRKKHSPLYFNSALAAPTFWAVRESATGVQASRIDELEAASALAGCHLLRAEPDGGVDPHGLTPAAWTRLIDLVRRVEAHTSSELVVAYTQLTTDPGSLAEDERRLAALPALGIVHIFHILVNALGLTREDDGSIKRPTSLRWCGQRIVDLDEWQLAKLGDDAGLRKRGVDWIGSAKPLPKALGIGDGSGLPPLDWTRADQAHLLFLRDGTVRDEVKAKLRKGWTFRGRYDLGRNLLAVIEGRVYEVTPISELAEAKLCIRGGDRQAEISAEAFCEAMARDKKACVIA